MILLGINYFKYLVNSTNQHGIHSPYVFDLVVNCFYNKAEYVEYSEILKYRKSLLKNNQEMIIVDYGAGSKLHKSNKRKINAICKTSGTNFNRTKLMFRISKYFSPNNVLEFGSSLGIATHALALGNPKAKITSIEGCPNISSFTRTKLSALGFQNIDIITGVFESVITKLDDKKWDLVFFDGHHDKEATLHYFEMIVSKSHNDSIFIIDDIHWSKGMIEAWNIIKAHPKVTVTVDVFCWGLVFFRKEQTKEHFIIRV